MPKYQVRFFLQLPEMEGRADKRDFGEVEARSADDAIEQMLELHFPPQDRDYARKCMTSVRRGKGTTAVLLRKQGAEIERLELELEQYKQLARLQKDRILDLEAGLRTCASASKNLLEKKHGD